MQITGDVELNPEAVNPDDQERMLEPAMEFAESSIQGHEPDQRLENLLAIDDFIYRVSHIDEDDYGDWMRRANLYWWDLVESLRDPPDTMEELMEEMHGLFQYNADFHLGETRRLVVELALEMRMILGTRLPLDMHAFELSYSESRR